MYLPKDQDFKIDYNINMHSELRKGNILGILAKLIKTVF